MALGTYGLVRILALAINSHYIKCCATGGYHVNLFSWSCSIMKIIINHMKINYLVHNKPQQQR